MVSFHETSDVFVKLFTISKYFTQLFVAFLNLRFYMFEIVHESCQTLQIKLISRFLIIAKFLEEVSAVWQDFECLICKRNVEKLKKIKLVFYEILNCFRKFEIIFYDIFGEAWSILNRVRFWHFRGIIWQYRNANQVTE